MKIKNIIKNWLDIKEPEKPKPIEKRELRKLVGEAFVEAFENRPDFEDIFCFNPGSVRNLIHQAIKEYSVKGARVAAENQIQSEEFIDKIVERIKRKQLKD